MKLFVYKSLVLISLLFILFHATVGYQIRNIEIKILNYFDKDKIIYLRTKIKDEITKSSEKERILSQEDAKIINKFLNKILREINSAK